MTATVEEVTEHSFDYIICGGGTAGLTLAARLSEDPDITVLVLEAGQANLNDPVILRPGSYGVHFANPNYAWPYQTSKQTGLLGLEPWWFRGKGLGGTSGINFMVWTKPPAEEINDWERLGNPGWNWGNYVTYLNRSEGFVPPSPEVQQRLHMKLGDWSLGKDGPVKVSFPGTINEVELTVMETLKNFGIHEAPLPLDGNPNGSFLVPNNYDPITHTRSYAATAHYLPNQNRRNLTVLVSAHVSRVITERASDGPHAATGVEFYYEDKPLIAHARKEVIVSAGALKSPHILELSGIGDKSLLHKIGIPVKIDLPGVGNNVQEHILGLMSWELRDDVDFQSLDILRDLGEAERQIELHADGKGVHTLGVVGLSFSPLRKITAKADAIISAAKARILEQADTYPPGRLEQFKIHLERLENDAPMCEIITFSGFMSGPNPPEPGKKYLSIFASLNQCWSRGTIHATSNDPQQEPEFDPHYFEEEIDKQLWFELIKFTRNLGKTAPLKDLIVKETNPGLDVVDDDDLWKWSQKELSTTWHTASSCSMLPRDKGGVVDHELKVHGTSNIRVVDLSVVPLHFEAHPQATVYAIAEQAADIIKGKFRG
ncbi:hypothetical protein CERSUDRAFT_79287 [Gelatoporia subvermispora B]|uniref:Glucose-methanol-choline oxidoreductase N-terminal domain-containing protein n=1 Tax=Ceriporiopsis subvermispora (strain B) TaxID=914234 RepID=M2RB38_CERS8|nr:hypothetical protein CERSUDRAFT_79287 [Gelatoporia subvermispora B]